MCRTDVLLIFISIAHINGQQLYQWSCSSLDPSTNLYTLPDLPVKDPAAIIRDPFSFTVVRADDLTIYSVPPMLDCAETVSAFEFCYSDTVKFSTEEHVFMLFTLNKNGSSFTVVNAIPVRSTPSPGKCANRTLTNPAITIQYCCDRFSLDRQDWFRLPADNFAFAITSYPRSTRKLLGYYSNSYPELIAPYFQVDIGDSGIPAVGSNFTLTEQLSTRALRMVNFVLGPTAATGPITIAGTPTNTESSLPTDDHTAISTSTPSPAPSSTPSPTSSSTPSLTDSSMSAERTDTSSNTASLVVSSSPINQLQHEGIGNTTPEISLGVIVGIAAGASCIVVTCIMIILVIVVLKWKARNHRLSHNLKQKDATQYLNTDTTSPNHNSNHYENQKKHMHVVITSSNDAYGVSIPSKLQDDDTYAKIDGIAASCMYSPEKVLWSDTSRHFSFEPEFEDDDSQHNYAAVADIIAGRAEDGYGMITPSDVAPNLAYSAGTRQDSQQDAKTGNFEATSDPPAVYSTNQAYGTGDRLEAEHEYADIAGISDCTSHRKLSRINSTHDGVATTSSDLPHSAGEIEYEDIEDANDSSVHAAMSCPNDAYGVQDEETMISSNQAYGVGGTKNTDQKCGNGATAPEGFNNSALKKGCGLGTFDADALPSADNGASATTISTNQNCRIQESGVQADGGHMNHYEHIPADNHYDIIGPANVANHQVIVHVV